MPESDKWKDVKKSSSRLPTMSFLPEPEEEPPVVEVTMAHSFLEELLPYGSDPDFLEDAIDIRGNLRVDRMLEDLDSFAAAVGYRHCDPDPTDDTPPRVTIVTASVSSLKYQLKPHILNDVLLRGFVTFVGRSSFEVMVRICNLDGTQVYLEGLFQMVALGKLSGKPVTVNRLKLTTPEEEKMFAEGEARFKLAKVNRTRSLLASETPPTPEETLHVHELHLEARKYENPRATDPALEQFQGFGLVKKPDDVRYISDTWLDNTILTHPQDRNVHFKIFGGHLLRLGYDLAWSVGTLFSRDRHNFLHMDEVMFKAPVEIGSLLAMGGHVTYTSPTRQSFVVSVAADVVNPTNGERKNSNMFHFIFYARPQPDANGVRRPVLPRVLPRTYDEMMLYLDAKRRWEAAKETAHQAGIDDLSRW
jgi:acyl-coenzyme A thioesterase 9